MKQVHNHNVIHQVQLLTGLQKVIYFPIITDLMYKFYYLAVNSHCVNKNFEQYTNEEKNC